MLLGYTDAKVHANPRNSTRFTRSILLVRGWGSGDETTITHGALLESLLVIKPLVIKALLPFKHFRNRLPMNHITD